MNRWQRRARLIVAAFGIAFAAFVAREMKRRTPPPAQSAVVDIAAGAVVESRAGKMETFHLSKEDASIAYDKQLLFADGTSKLVGVTITSAGKSGNDSFVATAKDATIGKDNTSIVLNGDVRLTSAEIRARTEHATFAKSDNTVRVPGPVEVTEGRTTATGVGMTFERDRDILTILDQAVVKIAADKSGAGTTDVTSAVAVFARREKFRRFERNVHMQRGGQIIEADTATAYLSADESHMDSVDLHGGARIHSANAGVGGLQALTAHDVTLKYTADGQSLEHAVLQGEAAAQVAGQAGNAGRQDKVDG